MKKTTGRRSFQTTAAGILGALVLAVSMISMVSASEARTTVSTDKFSVQVPDDIMAISDIKTPNNSISFYEKIASQDRYGGFVGGIFVYDNLSEYGNAPSYTRGGEIDYPDGSKLDIVIMYPTDVQFDPSNTESHDNYKAIGEAFSVITGAITPTGDGTYVPQDQIDTTGIYTETLEKLIADLKERKDPDALEEDDFSYIYGHFYDSEGGKDPLDEIGYAFVDVNKDGYSELLIGGAGDTAIFDLFAPVDGKPVHILYGGERNSYYLVGHSADGYLEIRNNASSSAFRSDVGFYILESNSPELLKQVVFVFDARQDENNPWFYDYGIGEEKLEPADEKEWNERIENFGSIVDPGYQPLSSYAGAQQGR